MPGPSPAGYQAPPSLYPGMGQSYQSARPSSNTGLIVAAIVAGVLLLSGLGLFAARNLLHSSNKTAGTSSQSTGGSSSSNAPTNTAATTDDYNVVCTGSAISNAATYSTAAPRPIALFEKGSGGNVDTSNFETSSIFLDNTTTPDYTQPQKIQLVGCLSRNGNGSTVKTCNLQDSNNKTVSLKIMNAPYTLDIYVAKTGKKLGSSTISQTDTSCPFFAAYDPSNPVYYATPDDNAVKVAVQTYTQ